MHRVNAKLEGNMSNVLKALNQPHVPQIKAHLLLDVTVVNGVLHLCLRDETLIAELNRQFSEAVLDLLSEGKIKLQAVVQKRTISE